MNSKLSEAIAKARQLSDQEQDAIADLVLDAIEHRDPDEVLTPEQWVEVEAAMNSDEPDATPEEVAAFFAKLKA